MNRNVFYEKAKGALALTVAMALFGTTIFAAEPAAAKAALSAAEQSVKAAEQPKAEEVQEKALPTLTYEEALKKSKEHSSNLRDLQDYSDFLQETKEDLWDTVGYFNVPTYDYQKWVNDGWYAVTSAAFQTDSGMKQNSLSRKMTELALETTVKNYFTTILSNQDTLKLAEETAAMQKSLYEQGQVKYKLGLLSKYDLDALQTEALKAQDSVKQLKSSLDQQYMKFNSMMGEKPETRFEFVYEVEYAPYEMKQSMEQYINDKISNDYGIQIKELEVENAKFNKNYLAESDSGSTAKKNDLSLDQAKRALKTAKEDKELAIRNAYVQIQQLELSYVTAQADLAKAEADLRAVQINYQAGNVTKINVEQAALGVAKAQDTLKQTVYNHDMAVFTFENPTLLGGSGSAE